MGHILMSGQLFQPFLRLIFRERIKIFQLRGADEGKIETYIPYDESFREEGNEVDEDFGRSTLRIRLLGIRGLRLP